MPPIREHNVIPDNDDERDDDAQSQSPAQYNTPMTYTFLSDMTPFPSSSQPHASSSQSQSSSHQEPSTSTLPTSPSQSSASPLTEDFPLPTQSPHRTRAPKKRDASYIPRPPNAFILYRSSFIRSNQVPGKVEGNHSTLSKIIGKLWKALPREERDEWEAKALEAQEEHRQKYPHWRFRPGAVSNPIVSNPKPKKAKSRRKVLPAEEVDELDEEEEVAGKGKAKAKGKGKGKEKRGTSLDDARCAKIAELVREGRTGEEMEPLLERWEEEWKKEHEPQKRLKAAESKKAGASSSSAASSSKRKPSSPSSSSIDVGDLEMKTRTSSSETIRPASRTPTTRKSRSPEPSRSGASPVPTSTSNSTYTSHTHSHSASLSVPLTQQYKRSLSAPARSRSPTTSPTSSPSASRATRLREVYEGSGSAASSPALTTLHSPAISIRPPPTLHPHSRPHQQRLHEHVRRDTVSIPISIHQTQTQNYSSPTMEHWHKGQPQQHHYWSSSPHSPVSAPLYPPTEHTHTVITTDGMGYESSASRYDDSFMNASYRAPVSNDLVSWGTNPDREGCVTLITDPFMHPECKTIPPPPPMLATTFNPSATFDASSPASPSISPSNTSAPPTATTASFYPPLSPVTPPTLPASTYSTLSGWAGETTPLNVSAGEAAWYSETASAGAGWDFVPESGDEWDRYESAGGHQRVDIGGQLQRKYDGAFNAVGRQEEERRHSHMSSVTSATSASSPLLPRQ